MNEKILKIMSLALELRKLSSVHRKNKVDIKIVFEHNFEIVIVCSYLKGTCFEKIEKSRYHISIQYINDNDADDLDDIIRYMERIKSGVFGA